MVQQVIDFLMGIYNWIVSPQGAIVMASLFAISEVLGSLEFFKQSSVFQYVVKALAWVKSKLPAKAA